MPVVQAKLRIGKPNDQYEQEADRVAEEVTRLPTRSSSSGTGGTVVPEIVHDVLGSPGCALDLNVRRFMESRFGHDFSQVRVHVDSQAVESAGAVNALAYTVGRDIVFGPGRYAPQTSDGRRLLAHELTHVLQQHASPQRQSPRVLVREPVPGGLTKTPDGGQTQAGAPAAANPPWATEDLKRKLAAVILAEAGPGQEDDVRWIYLNLVTAAGGEAGLKKSSAYENKGIEYRRYLYTLGDQTYGDDVFQGQTIADFCTTDAFWTKMRVPRATRLKGLVDAMLTAPGNSPHMGWTGQGSLQDFNNQSNDDEYWRRARAYFFLQEQGIVKEIYVKVLPPTVPKLLQEKKGTR